MAFKTADLYDRYGENLQICEPLFRDFGGRRAFSGQIATVKCFEDNSKVREAVFEPGEGRVLVVDAGGSLRCAMLGDMLAAKAVDNRWNGIIMYGLVRDSAELAGMPLGVKALGTHPRKSEKKNVGERERAVSFAGIRFVPGDYVYADEDGIVCSQSALDL